MLRHGDGGDHLAPQRRRQVPLLQLVAAVPVQGRGGHVGLHGDGHRHAGAAHPPEFLAEDHRVGVIRALAAVGRGVLQAEQPGRAEGLEDVVRGENPGCLPFLDVRHDLAREYAPHRMAERLVLGGKDNFPPWC